MHYGYLPSYIFKYGIAPVSQVVDPIFLTMEVLAISWMSGLKPYS